MQVSIMNDSVASYYELTFMKEGIMQSVRKSESKSIDFSDGLAYLVMCMVSRSLSLQITFLISRCDLD